MSDDVFQINEKIEIRKIIHERGPISHVETADIKSVHHNDPSINIGEPCEINKIETIINRPVINKEATIEVVSKDQIVIKTTCQGPQGPMGETSTFNDLEIPSLKVRFLNRIAT